MASKNIRLELTEDDNRRIAKLMKRHNIGTKTGLLRAALHAYAKHLENGLPPSKKMKRSLKAIAVGTPLGMVPHLTKSK